MEYEHTGHAVHLLVYHFVWCPKYRRPVLVDAIADRMRTLCATIAAEHAWTILELAVQPDHVHLFVRCSPADTPNRVVRAFKGRTSHVLRREFRGLRSRLPTLWTRSYFCGTAGNVSAAAIQRYIAAQKGM